MSNVLEVRKFKKGEVIFREGQIEICMYDILYGRVGIYANYGKPNQTMLTELFAEDFFGEIGLIEVRGRSATAVALEETAVNHITQETFGDYFRNKPSQVLAIMQHMGHRIRQLTDDYLEACQTLAEVSGGGLEKNSWLKEKIHKFSKVYQDANKK